MATPQKNRPVSDTHEKTLYFIRELRKTGLEINNEDLAITSLTDIGYPRFREYCLPFYSHPLIRVGSLTGSNTFVYGTTLENIVDLYEFDRTLRLMVLSQIQKVETHLRLHLSEHMATHYGSRWLIHLAVRTGYDAADIFFEQLSATKDIFIEHYHNAQSRIQYPLSGMITSAMNFGPYPEIYRKLAYHDQKAIAIKLNLHDPRIMASWLLSLSHLRHICTHHYRLWNRVFSAFPPRRLGGYAHHMVNTRTLYSRLVVLKYLSGQAQDAECLKTQLSILMRSKPECVAWGKMGFIQSWENDPLWLGKAEITVRDKAD